MSLLRRANVPPDDSPAPAALERSPEVPTPEDELPDHVMSSVGRFLNPFFYNQGPLAAGELFGPAQGRQRDFVVEIERTCRIKVPWQLQRHAMVGVVWHQMNEDRARAVRVLDYALGELMLGYEAQGIYPAVEELNEALRQAGANFVVIQPNPQRVSFRLERRTLPGAAVAASRQTALPGNASIHLEKARKAAFGQEPNPGVAYSESVKAVEAAAIPIVLPNDPLATLGKIIGELRANTQKYSVVFSRGASPAKGVSLSPLEVVIALADSLWSNQTDRHAAGDPQPSVPITQAQAELAFNIAVTLVHAFRSAIS